LIGRPEGGRFSDLEFMALHHVIAWGIFLALVLVMLAIDLLVLHRKPHEIHFKEALLGSLVPVAFAMLFIGAIYLAYETHFLEMGFLPAGIDPNDHLARMYAMNGREASLLFLTGYLVELSLSADNVFLFVVLMAYFRVPRQLQHRVLFWGVLGALVMRGIMILTAAKLAQFEWVIYVFGAFLIFTGFKMFFSGGEQKDPSDNMAVRVVRRILPFQEGFEGQSFFTRVSGRRVATTLFLVLVCIEFTDLVFALDSIPAVFGITLDPFIVFTSNVFAILGLRSMYFLLAGVIDRFHLLKYGLAVVLGFVGVKMVLPGASDAVDYFTGRHYAWEIDKYVSLAVIVLCLGGAVGASLVFPPIKRHGNPLEEEDTVKKLAAAGP
jgi:tellurite resistance protein TerC